MNTEIRKATQNDIHTITDILNAATHPYNEQNQKWRKQKGIDFHWVHGADHLQRIKEKDHLYQ